MHPFKRYSAQVALALMLVLTGTPVISSAPVAAQVTVQQNSPSVILGRLKQANRIPAGVAQDIRILESSDLNAATNGTSIVFSQGLWNALQSDDQRAFVIAHEMAHITQNHVPQTQVRRVGLTLLGSALGHVFGGSASTTGSQLYDIAQSLGIDIIDKKFSRSAELGADQAALTYMVNAGYDPEAALRVFSILETQAGRSHLPEFLQSHPVSTTRTSALMRQIATYKGKTSGQSAMQESPPSQYLAPVAQPVAKPSQYLAPVAQPVAKPPQYGQPVIILRQIQ